MKRIVIMGNIASSMLNFREHLIKDLVGEGYDVFCLATDYTKQDEDIIENWGATAIKYTFNRGGLNPFADFIHTIKLAKLLKEISPDIVLSCFVKPVIFGSIAAKIAGVPIRVGMLEGLGYSFTKGENKPSFKAKLIKSVQVFLYHLSLPTLTTLLFLNTDDEKDLIVRYNIKVKKSIILGGIGLNLDDFPYSPQKENTPVSFLFIGRLLREKGIFEYLSAAEKIKQKYPEVIFYVLGNTDDSNPGAVSNKILNDYVDNNIITYPGHVKNIAQWISKCSVFVLPSYREGVPRSTQEAMAMGKPIITTDVPGCRDTVDDGKNGFLVQPFSDTALIEKMMYFIEHKTDIAKMGKQSRKIAEEKFDVTVINKRLINILESN